MQLRLPRRVQIWDALLPHNPKCRHPRHLRVATILFLGGFEVALGSLAPPFEIGCWIVDVGGWMFRTANRLGSQRVGMGLGVGPSGAFLPSWPLRTGTVRGPVQSLMQPCIAGSQAGIRLVFPRRGISCG